MDRNLFSCYIKETTVLDPDPRGASATSDPVVQGGPTQFVFWRDSIYTLDKSDPWS